MRLTLAALAAFLAVPAWAQDHPVVPPDVAYTEDHDRGEGVVGVLTFENRVGSAPRPVVIETSRGALALDHHVTGCVRLRDDACADTLVLREAPPGLTLHPVEVRVLEGESAEMLLMPAMF